MLMVSPDAKDGVTQRCQREGCTNAAKKKFCSSACRQAAYRNSEAHKAILAKDREWRLRRRNAYFALKNRDRALTFDPVYSGPSSSQTLGRGSLGRFWTQVVDGKRMRLRLQPDSPARSRPATAGGRFCRDKSSAIFPAEQLMDRRDEFLARKGGND